MNGPKIYFSIPILGGIPITQTTVSSFLVMVILCTVAYFLGRNLEKRKPGKLQTLTEQMINILTNLVGDTMGEHNIYWTPYIGALFLSSMCGTYIGMTGFLRSSTADLSTTLTWAIMTSVLVWAGSIRTVGFGTWIRGYMNPLNIVSDISQPVSMAFRHFGNIAGGGVLTSLLYTALAAGSSFLIGLIKGSHILIAVVLLIVGVLIFLSGRKNKKIIRSFIGVMIFALALLSILEHFGILAEVPVLQVGIPAILSLYFDIFSGLVQALVFSLLTMVYVGSALPAPESGDNN